ncbi:hypothetical protein BP5796_08857 [Coleophoma crateriformis]|uniref:DUF1275 domain protein n=1 Tax=Coleophoma crateriformis TaxID=565419 RepID=A0A3D8R2M5_9HELO|nr:hypothetical protein BP5796_08857 [Coleophoma crateriformis]
MRYAMGYRIRKHMESNVSKEWADLLLIVCFYISGLIDSVAFNVWSCFVSMQTGNTIFVGLGVSNQPYSAAPFGWAKSLTAIGCFIIGAFSFANFHRRFGPTKRWVLIISFGFQALMIAIAAILATAGVVSNNIKNDRQYIAGTGTYIVHVKEIAWKDLAPLAILAFQGSGQIVVSRLLKYNELPTVVLTSLFCDLMSDAKLLTAPLQENPQRNRRAVAAVCLFLGATCGGYLTISWAGLAGALWIASFLKGCITIACLFWSEEKEKS